MQQYFLFGRLRHLPFLHAVLGRAPVTIPACLPGCRSAQAQGRDDPVLVAEPGARAAGVLVGVDAEGAARIEASLSGQDLRLEWRQVETDSGPVMAGLWTALSALPVQPPAPWSPDHWAARFGVGAIAALPEITTALRHLRPDAQAARRPMLMAHAHSRARARVAPAPARNRRKAGPDDVICESHGQPYNWFFAVAETDLRFRRFDGTFSDPVRRAGFIMSDAVTVLPYDPVRDRVLLVEQFRYGPWLRDDPNPWVMEPIAGRIDAGEEPDEAVRREAVEEAGLELRALHLVGRNYPSPGGVSEYLYCYVGIADLPDSAAGLGGLDSEAEDIRAHVMGFDTLMDMVDTGEAENGPLLLSAHWLARHRDRLRGQIARDG